MSSEKGVLYVVSTPIGNLEDISERALRVLGEVETILCEDTRTTKKLLSYYQIKASLLSFHRFSEESQVEKVINWLKTGKALALVSEAGTPAIADPGSSLIRRAHEEKIRIEAVPGASALTIAFSLSGFTPPYHFWGFYPEKKTQRFLLQLSLLKGAHFFFLSPHQLEKALRELAHNFPASFLFLAKEVTKIHEAYFWGFPQEIIEELEKMPQKKQGEWVLGLKPGRSPGLSFLARALRQRGLSKKDAGEILHTCWNFSFQEIYQEMEKEEKRDGE